MTPPSLLPALLSNLFDYAGEFPPASEPFERALQLSAGFRTSLKRPYLVAADLVTSIKHVETLRRIDLRQIGFDPNATFKTCFLGSTIEGAQQELEAALTFNHIGNDGITRQILSFEIRINPDSIQTARVLSDLTQIAGSQRITLALEPDLSRDTWEKDCIESIELVKRLSDSSDIVLKLRGNGPTAITRPKLAYIIDAALTYRVRLKISGGCHHPIIEPNRYQSGNDFGFLNILVALCFRLHWGAQRLSKDGLLSVLNFCSIESFHFDERSLSVSLSPNETLTMTANEIDAAIKRLQFTIGSCSLDEPDQDLIRLLQ